MNFSIFSKCILAIIACAWAGQALAKCYEEAGMKYGINPQLLRAIAVTESDENPLAVSPPNKDGSRDFSMMQINPFWYPKLAHYGVRKEDLKDPCQSVHAAAWILAQEIERFGNSWRAVGAYNAGPGKGKDAIRSVYVQKVWKNFNRLDRLNK